MCLGEGLRTARLCGGCSCILCHLPTPFHIYHMSWKGTADDDFEEISERVGVVSAMVLTWGCFRTDR